MDSKKIEDYTNKIAELDHRNPENPGGSYEALKPPRNDLYNIIKGIADSDDKKEIRSADIREAIQATYPLNDPKREELPNIHVTDFCYNKVNLDDENKFLLSVGRGRVLYVGFGWRNEQEEEITWRVAELSKTFVIGIYYNRKFDWNFDGLKQYLE